MRRRLTRASQAYGCAERWFPLLTLCLFALILSGLTEAVSVVGQTTRMHVVAKGQVVEGVIRLQNLSPVEQDVRVYLTDYISDDRSGWQFPAGSLPRSCAPWTRLLQEEIKLRPGEERGVFYRISVPDESDIRGTYWCSIMVQPQTASAVDVRAADDGEGRVLFTLNQAVRYQVAVIVNVGDSGERRLTFTDPQLLRTKEERVVFRVFIENQGERLLHPDIWLELYDDQGRKVGSFSAGKRRVLPGASRTAEFDLSDVPPGDYLALVLVDDGGDAVFGARYSLRFIADNGT